MSTHIMIFLSTTLLLALSVNGGGAAPPPVDCTTLVLNLADCLSFVSAGSEVEKPEGTCCPGLKSVLKSHADCLCEAFKNSAQFGVTLNVSKALSLPAACHVSAPSVSNCGSAEAPPVDCITLVLNLADCLSFVSAGSEVEKPEGTCCPGLKSLLKSHAECLCEAFKNSAQYGVTLNVSKALALPAACHVSAPSGSDCGLSLVTGSAPASAPVVAMSPSIPVGSPTLALGSIEAPAPASSASRFLTFSTLFFLISTVVAFCSF